MAKDKNNFDPGFGNFKFQLKSLIHQNPKIGEIYKENESSFYQEIDKFLYQMISDKVDELIKELPENKNLEKELVESKIEDLEISGKFPEDENPPLEKEASKFEKIAIGKIKT